MVSSPYRFVFLLVLLLTGAYAGTVPQGGSCSADNDHLDPATRRLLTECDDKTFCSAPMNGTCVQKNCVRDEYPFGYIAGETIPPLCPHGTFCPDEGSGCRTLLAIDQPCQLNRDEQCAPPPANFDDSVCLQEKCRYTNVTFGQTCLIENTTYIDLDLPGEQFITGIIRDNCHTPEFFCDSDTMLCKHAKVVGGTCQADWECKTHNCSENGHCINQPETPLKVAPWQYATMALCIVAAITAAGVALNSIHKRCNQQRHQEIRDYYNEQTSLRRAIISLHEAAAVRFKGEKLQSRAGQVCQH